jgi:hypothetical protein
LPILRALLLLSDFPRQFGAVFELESQVMVAVNRDCFDHGIPQALIELRMQTVALGFGGDEFNQLLTLGPAVKTLLASTLATKIIANYAHLNHLQLTCQSKE